MRGARHTRIALALALGCLVVLPALAQAAPAARYRVSGARWPGTTIRYYSTLDSSWNWSLDHAVASWNSSGAAVRFVPTRSRASAQLTIGLERPHGAELAHATVGRHAGATLRIGSRTARTTVAARPFTTHLFAHELGHVLGLDHVPATASCTVMTARLLPACVAAQVPRAGYFDCSPLSIDDVRGAVRLYGGRVKAPPLRRPCAYAPLPPALLRVTLQPRSSATDVGTLTWVAPRTQLGTWQTVVERRTGPGCTTVAKVWTLAPATTRLLDAYRPADSDGAIPAGPVCYDLYTRNTAQRTSPRRRVTTTWSPPALAAPAGISLREWPASTVDYAFSATLPDTASVRVQWGAAGACPATVDEGTAITTSYVDGLGPVLLYVPTGPGCLSWFSVDPSGAESTSAPTQLAITHADAPPG
ncbi:MAG: hypothetical protein JWM98_810 [Thermoleophilia bacterium]|nr:hypothetical protein [Thermoleophilia bacterium]